MSNYEHLSNIKPFYTAQWSADVWDKVRNSLIYFVRMQTEALKQENASDREWQELKDYEDIINHINFYILPPDK